MKILLTGANGYIGRRLLPVLILKGHDVVCLVRDRRRLKIEKDLIDKVTFLRLICSKRKPSKNFLLILMHHFTWCIPWAYPVKGFMKENSNLLKIMSMRFQKQTSSISFF